MHANTPTEIGVTSIFIIKFLYLILQFALHFFSPQDDYVDHWYCDGEQNPLETELELTLVFTERPVLILLECQQRTKHSLLKMLSLLE